MKRTIIASLVTLAFGAAGTAIAAPKGPKSPPQKTAILHCGCADDGSGMEYRRISVSSKSRGHRNHVPGSIDSCTSNGVDYFDFVRTKADCHLSGPALVGVTEACVEADDDVEGASCGVALP